MGISTLMCPRTEKLRLVKGAAGPLGKYLPEPQAEPAHRKWALSRLCRVRALQTQGCRPLWGLHP